MSENVLRQGLTRYLSPARLEALRAARVGVAGAGGLGSNAVLMLARSGVEHFLLIDDDVVDASNLNRQQFWPRHLGRPKVEALAELVRELNPDARVETCRLRIDAANVDELVARCPLWLEAMDGAADKRLLVEKVMLSGRRIAIQTQVGRLLGVERRSYAGGGRIGGLVGVELHIVFIFRLLPGGVGGQLAELTTEKLGHGAPSSFMFYFISSLK